MILSAVALVQAIRGNRIWVGRVSGSLDEQRPHDNSLKFLYKAKPGDAGQPGSQAAPFWQCGWSVGMGGFYG
jgi:hypothetical protein